MKKPASLFIVALVVASTASQCGPAPSTVSALPIATQAIPTPTPRSVVVNSAADPGPGTLRQALEGQQPGDIITFDPAVFPPHAPVAIPLFEGLPEITQGNITVDASNAGVILDGAAVTNVGSGLTIMSNGNTIRGLQIVNFSDAGITILGGAQDNVVGGDRKEGTGPLGQGNLISGNGNFGISLQDQGTSSNTIVGNYIGVNLNATEPWGHPRDGITSNGASKNLITGNVIGGNDTGVYICCAAEGGTVISDNIIGTDPSARIPLGNHTAGVLIDRSNHNTVGPGNLIAYNNGPGVMFWDETAGNTVTENSIRGNGPQPTNTSPTSQAGMLPPVILDFDLDAGTLAGATCPSCVVEVFSDTADEGGTFEARATADQEGAFQMQLPSAFRGPQLTATATDPTGTSSSFSAATVGTGRSLTLQVDGTGRKFLLEAKPSAELADNRIGFSSHGAPLLENLQNSFDIITDLGVKRIDVVYGEIEPPIDWSLPEYEISSEFDAFIDNLGANGVAVNYILHYWDKTGHAEGAELATPRFATEDQVQDYLDYVRFMVNHFKGRVQYYTIWSEPDNCAAPAIKCVRPLDYIELARRTIPVIREEDPEAEVVLAPVVLYFARDYLFTLLRSDVLAQFDVISWHGLYDAAPDEPFFGNYYYDYPSIVESIRQTAAATGFKGEYWGTELTWRVEGSSHVPEGQPWPGHSHIQSAKYWARGIVMELGMDLGVGLGGPSPDLEDVAYHTVQNVNSIMAGSRAASLEAEIDTEADNIVSYGFSLPDGSTLFAIWANGAAADDASGVPATITFPDLSAKNARAIDVLNGFEQELAIESQHGRLVIPDLLVMDYPIVLRLEP